MAKNSSDTASHLDRPLARAAALGVVALVALFLGYFHREDLFPPEAPALSAEDQAIAACLAQRGTDIDQMASDGVIDENQAKVFKTRAEALCRAQAGGGQAN